MAYTQQQLTAIEAAIAEGALVVQYEGKRVEYRSLADMIKIRDLIKGELGLNANSDGGVVYPSFSKGLGCV